MKKPTVVRTVSFHFRNTSIDAARSGINIQEEEVTADEKAASQLTRGRTQPNIFINLTLLVSVLGLASETVAASAVDANPNIVWILLDNIGYGDLGCYGNHWIKTPHIDRLATEGVRCSAFCIGSPSCMPSRGALLTGRHPLRNGLNEQIWRVDSREQVGLPQDEILLPTVLKRAGYVSGCFGKWNLGFAPGSRPTDRGFDEYLGIISGNCDYYSYVYNGRHDLYRNTEPAHAEGYSTFVFANAACEFIRRYRERNFFCYVPFNAAHFPNPKNKKPGQPTSSTCP